MKSHSVLIVGCGDIGIRTGALLLQEGWSVTGVRRSVSALPPGFEPRAADYTVRGSLDFAARLAPEYVVATFSPANRTVDGYRAGFERAMDTLLAGLGEHRPRLILMASSTRVFAEEHGGWVDETSPLTTRDPRAQAIIRAERRLLDSGHAAAIVRFGGIYGHPGGRLLTRVSRGELCAPEPVIFGNRIHRDDCAGFITHLLCRKQSGQGVARVYIAVDDLPAPRYEVERWLASELGVTAPVPGGKPASASTAGHKRCRNRALHDSGYALLYPDYRSGYRALVKAAAESAR